MLFRTEGSWSVSPPFSAHRCQSWRRPPDDAEASAVGRRHAQVHGAERCALPGLRVVSNIRQVEPEDLGGRSPDAGVEIRTGESGPVTKSRP